MPGVVNEPKLTAEQFQRWKAEKEKSQKQVKAADILDSMSFVLAH